MMGINRINKILRPTIIAVVILLFLEGLIILKNLDMQSYNIEMWKYSKNLKRKSQSKVIGHEHLPNSSAILQGVEIKINSLGLRGADQFPTPGSKKIFLLGNSITLGWGLPWEDTISAQLQNLEDDAIIYNGGVGNYNLMQSVNAYFEKYHVLKPSHIFIQYYPNDAEEIQSESKNTFLRILLKNSQLMVSIWTFYSQIKFKLEEGSMKKHYEAVYEKNSKGLMHMEESLVSLGEHCNANDIKCTLFFVPDLFDPQNSELDFIKDIVAQKAQRSGLKYVDLSYVVNDTPEPKRYWVTSFDPHPNAEANAKMALVMHSSSMN